MFLLLFCVITAARELLYVVEVCRHGARSPMTLQPWDTVSLWPQGPGELTPAGMRQHFLLGAELRQRYIVNEPLLDPEYSAPQLHVRSTDVNRTLSSASSQLLGMYPQGPVLKSESLAKKAVPPMGTPNTEAVVANLGLAALPHQAQVVPASTVPRSDELLLHMGQRCPAYRELTDSRLSGKPLRKIAEQHSIGIEAVADYFGVSMKRARAMAIRVYDSIVANQFHGHENIPEVFTQEEVVQSLTAFYNKAMVEVFYNDPLFNRVLGTRFMEELMSIFDQAIESPDFPQRFSLYSAHDSTLLNFLTAFELDNSKQPMYASTLFFELFIEDETPYVRVLYNDVPQQLVSCASATCTYDEFRSYLQTRVVPNLTEACELLPSPKSQTEEEVDFGWYFWVGVGFLVAFSVLGLFCLTKYANRPGLVPYSAVELQSQASS